MSNSVTLENEGEARGIAVSGDRQVLGLGAVLVMPGLNRVSARGQVLDLERTVIAGNGKKRVVQHSGRSVHPRMDFTFDLGLQHPLLVLSCKASSS